MTMVSYLFQAPTGIPGDITRTDESNVEPALLVALTAVFAQRFGEAMRYVSGGIQQWTTGLSKADFAGVLVREVPAQGGNANSGFSDTIPNPEQLQGLLVRGYVSVKCTAGTPVRGGTVYVRIVDATDRPIGAFEADSDGGNSVALDAVQAEWATDGKDADGNAELRVAR
jgi:hypothetical protein